MRYVMLPYASINGKTVAKWDVIYDRELLTEVTIHPEVRPYGKSAILLKSHSNFIAFWYEPNEKRKEWRFEVFVKNIDPIYFSHNFFVGYNIFIGFNYANNGHPYTRVTKSGLNPAVLFQNVDMELIKLKEYFAD